MKALKVFKIITLILSVVTVLISIWNMFVPVELKIALAEHFYKTKYMYDSSGQAIGDSQVFTAIIYSENIDWRRIVFDIAVPSIFIAAHIFVRIKIKKLKTK